MTYRLLAVFALVTVAGVALAATLASCAAPTEEGPAIKRLFVGPRTVECEGVAPQMCLLVKENPEDEWTLWYEPIEGFEFEEGYEYELLVEEVIIENPPADASSLQLRLVEEVSKTPVE